MPHSLVLDHMFQLPLPILEKLARPVIVYLVLVVLLRIFGKRELAQLNPFDLVVLLSLSNTVQNAIIGDDNSVTGGVIGAFGLLAINWLVVRVLFRSPRLTRACKAIPPPWFAMASSMSARSRASPSPARSCSTSFTARAFEDFHQVKRCELEPNGTFYVEPVEPRQPTCTTQSSWRGLTRSPAKLLPSAHE